MFCREVIAVCCKNHAKHTNSVCGQNAKFLNIKPGGTYSNHHPVDLKINLTLKQLQQEF